MPRYDVQECRQCNRQFKNDNALQQVLLIYMLLSIFYAYSSRQSTCNIHQSIVNRMVVLHAIDRSETSPPSIITPKPSIQGILALHATGRSEMSPPSMITFKPSILGTIAFHAIGRSNTSPPLIVTVEPSIEREINRIIVLYAVGRSETSLPSIITLKPSITGATPAPKVLFR